MKEWVYWTGRSMQLLSLLVLPSAIWVGTMGHDEQACIMIFLGCLLLFYAGYFLTRLDTRL